MIEPRRDYDQYAQRRSAPGGYQSFDDLMINELMIYTEIETIFTCTSILSNIQLDGC